MAKLGTLDTIIDDIMLELRNNSVSESEQLSRIQIEQWIIQYRAMLIKQDIDKGRDINPAYVQEIGPIDLNITSYSSGEYEEGSDNILVSSIDIPKTIDFHFKSGITYIGDLAGNEIQLMSEKRSNMQKHRKYTFYNYSAYIKGSKVWVNGPGDLHAISVRGIFENPANVPNFDVNEDIYPIPANMLPVLKELIFAKEIKLQVPTDDINNSSDDTKNISRK